MEVFCKYGHIYSSEVAKAIVRDNKNYQNVKFEVIFKLVDESKVYTYKTLHINVNKISLN